MSLESAAEKATNISPWFWLIPAGLVIAGLVLLNWRKIQAAWTAAKPEAPQSDLPPADATLDQIGALKNGFALLLELDRYSPPSMKAEERDALLLDGVKRLLKARSEARK